MWTMSRKPRHEASYQVLTSPALQDVRKSGAEVVRVHCHAPATWTSSSDRRRGMRPHAHPTALQARSAPSRIRNAATGRLEAGDICRGPLLRAPHTSVQVG